MPQTKKRAKKQKMDWRGQIVLIFGIFAGLLLLPTTIFLCVAMLPTIVAVFADRKRDGVKPLTVGAMNMAGSIPFLINLWVNGHTMTNAIDLVLDPLTIVIVYSAAAIGYLIDWAMTGIIVSLMFEKGRGRLKVIEKRKEALVERWGREVTGNIPLDDYGFALNDDHLKEPTDDEAEEDAEDDDPENKEL